jgi:hypothetical protein
MRSLFLDSCIGLALAAAVACRSGGDEGASGTADLSADGGAPLTPVQAAAQKLSGVWVASTPDGPVAYLIFDSPSFGLQVERDTPHKSDAGPSAPKGRDRISLHASVTSADASGGGVVELSETFVVASSVDRRIGAYRFSFGSLADGDTLTLTETTETVFKVPPFGSDAGLTPVDAGPISLRPTIVLTRRPSFCSSGSGDITCFQEFQEGLLQMALPAECQGREDVCLHCNAASNACEVHVPSSCELAHFTCVDSLETCERGGTTGISRGEVTEVDPDGNPVDCNGSPTKQPICCEALGFSF